MVVVERDGLGYWIGLLTLCFPPTATTAQPAALSLENITVIFAIYGCPDKSLRITAPTVDSVAWVAAKILPIVMTAACALMPSSFTITTANRESTCPTVPSVKKICFPPGMPHTKCPAATRFTGTVSKN